jgi:hypothetical protein
VFDFFSKKQADSVKGKPGPIISALLLEGESFPVDAFLEQVAKARFVGKAASRIERGDGHVFSFDVVDEFLALALMPVPYPAKDLEGPIATSWLWPRQTPIEAVKRHRSHLPRPPIDRLLSLSKLLSGCCRPKSWAGRQHCRCNRSMQFAARRPPGSECPRSEDAREFATYTAP